MVNNKNVLLFTLAIHVLCVSGCVLSSEDRKDFCEEIEVRKHFSLYSSSAHGIDLAALYDLGNNSILNICLRGATNQELEELGIEDLANRLRRLREGKIVKRKSGRYYLAFPTVFGKDYIRLQELAQCNSMKLLPDCEEIVAEISTHLKGREEMLFHVLWSLIIDGPFAWSTTKSELQARYNEKAMEFKIENTAWITCPRHPYHVGTNGYGQVIITWSFETPAPNEIYKTVKKLLRDLKDSGLKNIPLSNPDAIKDLAQYGLVDQEGMIKAYIVDAKSETAKLYMKLGKQFGHKFAAHFNVEETANLLDVSPGEGLVIAYHEICYEILQKLADKGLVEVPPIVLRPKEDIKQMCRLITIVSEVN